VSRELVNAHCATLPFASVSEAFGPGHDVWKIGGKIFAISSSTYSGVSVKCADIEAAQLLIEMGVGSKAPYLHASWVMFLWDAIPDDELRARLSASYLIMRKSLPKKVQAGLV
jgi:predicted DNA-binding protein (MmcQ/YjbR family)